MSQLDRLESWVNSHKARHCDITIGSGYGATCWEVTLWGLPWRDQTEDEKSIDVVAAPNATSAWQVKNKHRAIHAAETNFFEYDDPPPNVVFVVDGDDLDEKDWPGLEATIKAALDRAEELGV